MMIRGRATTAVSALVLVLALASCGPVATYGRPVPAAGGGVIGLQDNQDQATNTLVQEDFFTGRALNAAGTTTSLPYVPSAPVGPAAACRNRDLGMKDDYLSQLHSVTCLCEETHIAIMQRYMQCHLKIRS